MFRRRLELSPKAFNSWAVIDFVADKLDMDQIKSEIVCVRCPVVANNGKFFYFRCIASQYLTLIHLLQALVPSLPSLLPSLLRFSYAISFSPDECLSLVWAIFYRISLACLTIPSSPDELQALVWLFFSTWTLPRPPFPCHPAQTSFKHSSGLFFHLDASLLPPLQYYLALTCLTSYRILPFPPPAIVSGNVYLFLLESQYLRI
jgi:hypothetical protein